ncbi:hypothetical protein CJF42_25665 [Pseudoalteromonas sp. NBT06-2]|uniref:helix-turn-helix domain-containing protein n=1 Tax=Pseudoalteromonas sp. NBT06-2 TaxID=2025950 RepID=UPI000BA51009|nr:helix-turn-helix domain-containing protein [Pseudoalteromonas sp. NBT06-2]PAJ71633.1 hypothetical protein CJF42_25665 [Pseudoalteromonas sp. NBT06-2]
MYSLLISILHVLATIVVISVLFAAYIAKKKNVFSKSVQQQALDIFLLELDENADLDLIKIKKEALKFTIENIQFHWKYFQNNRENFEQIKNISLEDKNKEILVMIENKIHKHLTCVFSDEEINDASHKICLDSLLSELSISKKKLNEVLINQGSFSQMYKNARLDYAAKHLKSTQIKLNKIQLMASYNDAASFREAFKKRYGITPSKYRKINTTL